MTGHILVLNSGSSSIKFSLYRSEETGLQAIERGQINRLGSKPEFENRRDGNTSVKQLPEDMDHCGALGYLLEHLRSTQDGTSDMAVGHRVVHGGTNYTGPVMITRKVIKDLQALQSLAPLHQPYNVAAIVAMSEANANLPQVACFDTSFHSGHKKSVSRFALPAHYYDEGIRRYGFHGLSYEYVANRLKQTEPDLASGKVIVAHLGNGASLCGMNNGKSVDTSMGFSALDGLMMGTRCGRIDAGVLLYFLQEKNMSAEELTELLYKKSGLLGVSGISNDMRDLLDSTSENASAAIDLYVYRIVAELGSLVSVLEGMDGLVFTGGIGENAARIRKRVCNRLGWLGVEIDEAANGKNNKVISTVNSRVKVCTIPTDEEYMIAQHTRELLG